MAKAAKGDTKESIALLLERLRPAPAILPMVRATLAAPLMLRPDFGDLPEAQTITQIPQDQRADATIAAAKLLADAAALNDEAQGTGQIKALTAFSTARWLIPTLLKTRPPFSQEQLCELIEVMLKVGNNWYGMPVAPVISAAKRLFESGGL